METDATQEQRQPNDVQGLDGGKCPKRFAHEVRETGRCDGLDEIIHVHSLSGPPRLPRMLSFTVHTRPSGSMFVRAPTALEPSFAGQPVAEKASPAFQRSFVMSAATFSGPVVSTY